VKTSAPSAVFGKRREPHTIIIARGNEIRHFTIRPWVAAFIGSAIAAIAIGYLLATSYLVLRDDLIGATISRQARMQHSYEDRISALRAQVDRITSRQLLDQHIMETKVSELLLRQSQLTERHGRLDPLLKRAESEAMPPLPTPKPDNRAELVPGDATAAMALVQGDAAKPFALWSTRNSEETALSRADKADKLFVAINQSLRSIESEQLNRVSTLADSAYQTADAISDALRAAGLEIDEDAGKNAMGGPFIAAPGNNPFETKVRELDSALDTLDKVKKRAIALPISNPAPGHAISSTFGIRKDPLLGTPAMHSGMDFRAPVGFPAKATASGVVVKAGWNGGYGRMVEIDHGNGYSTRFAHLSQIDVVEGQKIKIGDVIGNVGSSGRSTGPHLHYEVRHNGEATDPLRFLKLGTALKAVL
jgi:murein DD-endopeptidase MepM/ murein hydrolase activator NlpD